MFGSCYFGSCIQGMFPTPLNSAMLYDSGLQTPSLEQMKGVCFAEQPDTFAANLLSIRGHCVCLEIWAQNMLGHQNMEAVV